MNLYRIRPHPVTNDNNTQSWHMPQFYIVAPNFTAASLLAQVEGIRRMNEANTKIEKHNVKIVAGEAESPFSWLGLGAKEMPVMPEFKVESIKLVQENVAVEGV